MAQHDCGGICGQPIAGCSYEETYKRSIENPEAFWAKEAESISWFKKWDQVLDDSKPPFSRWFKGAETNICYNAVDRHALGTGRNKAAIIYENPDASTSRVITYFELYRMVNRFAAVLKNHGVQKGDRVVIYMPMVPEGLVAVLGSVRIGAVHVVVFSGFSVETLAARIIDSKPKVVICAEAASRKGKKIPMKGTVDEALAQAAAKGVTVSKCLVFDRKIDSAWPRVPGRDIVLQEEMEKAGNVTIECERMKSEDPSYILYTAGATGRAIGVLRDTGGYLVGVSASMKYIFGCGPSDIFWSTSDIGWVTGHSYIIYGPLITGIPTVVFDGTPDSPTPAIWWEVVEKYGITMMLSAPTAVRLLRKLPHEFLHKADTSSLRAIFMVGEPLDVDTYKWATEALGKEILDQYWQTETGWVMITNHKGLSTLPIKPGSPAKTTVGWKCEVVNPQGEIVKPGERGELIVKPPLPPGFFLTVYNDDQFFVENYFTKFKPNYYTGDLAMKDADGYLWLLGRADEVVNVSGHRLSIREAEQVISESPKVAEVSSLGIDDSLTGQAIAAFVVLKSGIANSAEVKQEIINLIRTKIGPIATPKVLLLVNALPKAKSGKIMKRLMKAIAEKRDISDPCSIEEGSSLDEIKKALSDMGPTSF